MAHVPDGGAQLLSSTGPQHPRPRRVRPPGPSLCLTGRSGGTNREGAVSGLQDAPRCRTQQRPHLGHLSTKPVESPANAFPQRVTRSQGIPCQREVARTVFGQHRENLPGLQAILLGLHLLRDRTPLGRGKLVESETRWSRDPPKDSIPIHHRRGGGLLQKLGEPGERLHSHRQARHGDRRAPRIPGWRHAVDPERLAADLERRTGASGVQRRDRQEPHPEAG